MTSTKFTLLILIFAVLSACNTTFFFKDEPLTPQARADSTAAYGKTFDSLAQPYATKSVFNFSSVKGFEKGQKPTAPAGFEVQLFANGLDKPRWAYELPNGDILIAESKADRVRLFRDSDGNGLSDTNFIFMENLNKPFGMLVLKGFFYVANTDGVLRFEFDPQKSRVTGQGQKILNLPSNGYNHHWTRNLLAAEDGSKIYVSVGSASNAGEDMEDEVRRANILEINPDGSGEKVFASGLRNPVGMDWNPETGELWTAVNERDALGDNLVPDFITSVKRGGFYGWPYSYFGQNVDPRRKGEAPEMVAKALKPDMAVGAHTASLGLAFYDQESFPEKYRNGVFVGQHGSWNRTTLNGYRVLFIPFENGKPTGKTEDFLTGFVADLKDEKVYGRPVGCFVLSDGSLLVTDDGSGSVWRVVYAKGN